MIQLNFFHIMISNFFSTMLLCNLKLHVQFSESSQSDCSIYVHILAEFFCSLTSNPGGGVLPYMAYIGMCGPKGYGFSAVLVINWVSILAILPPFWS